VSVSAGERLFVSPRLPVLPRSEAPQSGPPDNSPALGALLLLALVLAVLFRRRLLARLSAADEAGADNNNNNSKSSRQDKTNSFLQGTIAAAPRREIE